MKKLLIDGDSLTIENIYDHCTAPSHIGIAPRAVSRIDASRRVVEEWIDRGETIYGVTTGFGEFSNIRIERGDLEKLQENLIVSHSAGVGEPLPDEVVRAMIILRLNALAKGCSGIRRSTMEFFCRVFNEGFVPIIPSRGSVGSSGDLAPLAHLVLAMLGKGFVRFRGKVIPAAQALRKIRVAPLALSAKEGLALVNGTQMMTALGVLAVHDGARLCTIADIAASMSVEALKGSDTSFDARIQSVRPHPGQRASATNLRRLMNGSEIRESHRFGDPRVQDAYSIRCIPQVHGASRDAVGYVYDVLTTEINSVTDNPLILAGKGVHLEGGNFHGQPIALALDFLAIALAELADISERRIERMVNGMLSGLPRFLTERGGLNSGMMLAQYTAASLVSENKVLSHPASVDSIPTSANQEDHNSMGSVAALKVGQVLKNAQTVVAIELMVAAQGMDFSRLHPTSGKIMKAGHGVQAAYERIRKEIPHLDDDRILADDIRTSLGLLLNGSVLAATERAVGRMI
jgi:histidine ammonia-lyase